VEITAAVQRLYRPLRHSSQRQKNHEAVILIGKTDPTEKKKTSHQIEANVNLYGPVSLGDHVWLEPNVTMFGPVEVGSGTYVGPNCILGFPDRGELSGMLEKRSREARVEAGKVTKVGKEVYLRSNCVLYSGTIVGDRVRFGHNVMVRENVTIGEGSLLGTNAVVDGSCRLGRNVSVQTGVYISTYTTIEDAVFLGPCCTLINDKYVTQSPYELRGPTIRKGASIGANAVIFPRVEVGEGAVVGAGAVVTKDVPSRVVVVGVPAVRLKDVPDTWRTSLG
jgi:acetyltransferase-like isoleucine patch superfamily enzyme